MRLIALALLFLVWPGPVTAQSNGDARNQEIEREISRMRDLLRTGKLVLSHVRLSVRLKNGNKIHGVVKNGKMIERVDGLHFVAADSQAEGAGVRLWYYDNTNSYIFLPFSSIASHKIGERLTGNQILAIEQKIEDDRRRADEARREYLAKKEAERKAADEKKDAREKQEEELRKQAEELAVEEKERKLLALLEEFPPEEGWSDARRQEIELLKVTAGVYPDERGRRFLEIFGEWSQALQLQKSKQAETPVEPPVGLPGSPPGGRRGG